jgi:aminoglycoside phosphotransferase (APT) family kinase protein
VRAGEEIDVVRLRDYLAGTLPELGKGRVTVEQFPSGYSNLTYLVRVGDRSVILRRPPFGVEIATAHDMGREYRILSGLRPVWPKVPEALAFCADPAVLGAPFYVMERVEGVILRKGLPESMIPEPQLAARIAGELVATLVELHEVDVAAACLSDLGRPEGYARRQVEGWTKRYRQAETDRVPEADEVAAWLAAAILAQSDATLIHNDFKHDNVVLDPEGWSKVIAVLDWEMATLGDPLMDLGTSLAYWVQPGDPPAVLATRLSPTTWPGTPSRSEIVDLYARLSGRDVHDIVFYYAFGLFKVAVIVQQLYARYVSGRTTDPRYAGLIDGVRALSGLASRAIERGRIDDLH